MFEETLRARVNEYLGKPYTCRNRHMACVLFVLEIMEPFSQELRECLERLCCMDITTSKKSLIQQDYFLKFIRSTCLKLQELTAGLMPGDILLINEYTGQGKIDHLGLYLGRGEYVHLRCSRNHGDYPQICRVDDSRNKILGIARYLFP